MESEDEPSSGESEKPLSESENDEEEEVRGSLEPPSDSSDDEEEEDPVARMCWEGGVPIIHFLMNQAVSPTDHNISQNP